MAHHANHGAGTFFSASKYIFNDSRLTSNAILVYLALESHADYMSGKVNLSRARIAHLAKLTDPTVGRALNLLEETKWLDRQSATVYKKGANEYTLHVQVVEPPKFVPVDKGKSKIIEENSRVTGEEIEKPEPQPAPTITQEQEQYIETVQEESKALALTEFLSEFDCTYYGLAINLTRSTIQGKIEKEDAIAEVTNNRYMDDHWKDFITTKIQKIPVGQNKSSLYI